MSIVWSGLTFAFCRTVPSAERRGIGVGQQRGVRRHGVRLASWVSVERAAPARSLALWFVHGASR